MNKAKYQELNEKCRRIRYLTLDAIGKLGIGHVGGCMSIVEALVVLYYNHMNIDSNDPKMKGRDRFILSKGHAGPALYSVLADKGYFDEKLLNTLNQPKTDLPSHCDMNKTPGIDMTTGSLGQGFSCAVGVALGAKIKNDNATVYTLIGDGESQEGQIWEAAMYAAHKKLDNLIAFTDYNRMQIDGLVNDINSIEPLDQKWRAFGWHVINVADGHSVEQIDQAIIEAKSIQDKPSMIILNTIKGKGAAFAEEAGTANHNMPVKSDEIQIALKELR